MSAGRGVGREDNLSAGRLERVECVKELLLRTLLAGDELNVIEEKHIDAAKCLTKGVHLLAADAVDEFVDELLGRHIGGVEGGRLVFGKPVGDRVQKVGFSEPGAAIEIQRVVSLAWLFGDRFRRRGGKLVRGSNDKSIEREARIVRMGGDARRIVVFPALARDLGRPRLRPI